MREDRKWGMRADVDKKKRKRRCGLDVDRK